MGEKQEALRQVALEKLAKGEIPAGTKVGKVAKGQYVELAREGEDSILTVLGEFGNAINPRYGGTPGPCTTRSRSPTERRQHDDLGAGLQPAYYKNLLFYDAPGAISMRNFYIEQSSNRYTVNGDVTDWVTGAVQRGALRHQLLRQHRLRDRLAVRQRLGQRLVRRRSRPARRRRRSNAYLAQFDVWDRYDYDGDGNFNEPDGYIDHFQSIHAGEGEETGGGAQGTDAIWSHRWYALLRTTIGPDGPGRNRFGGVRIGSSTTGSATTRSSRRTAASACSRTSSATTSACRTSTTRRATPAAPRTARASGRSCRRARTATTAPPPRASATGRST